MEKIIDAQVYVGTYRKYNEGSLFGEWVALADYSSKEEFYDYIRQLHKDEADPEFMFQDWENIPSAFIGECSISDNIFDLIEVLSGLDDTEQEAFCSWAGYLGYDLANKYAENIIAEFRDAYCGQYDSEEAYAEELIEQCYDLPEFAQRYFDYEKFARDLFIGDNLYLDGYVFNRC